MPDTAADTRFGPSWADGRWAALLSAPLLIGDAALGNLVVLDTSTRHWSREEEASVAALAAAVAVYLRHDHCTPLVDTSKDAAAGSPHLDVLLNSATLLIGSADATGIVTFSEGKTEDILGLPAAAMVGRHITDAFAPFPELVQDLFRALTGTPFRAVRRTGDRWLDLSYRPLIQNGRAIRVDVTALDVTDEHRLRQDLQRLSHHDSLTGLLNRTGLERQLDGVLRTRRGQPPRDLAYVLIDLDGFGQINGDLGPDAGSAVLTQVADRLRAWAKPGVMLARTGSDEFAAVLPDNLLRTTPLDSKLQRLRQALSAPYTVQNEALHVTTDIGVARGSYGDLEALASHAETALHQAKQQGAAQTVVWTPDLSAGSTVNLAGRLRAAIDAGDIDVHYQPIICTTTGRVLAVEALARWTDDDHGPVPPDLFIPVAERSGLIKDLGALVLRTALQDAKRWDPQAVPRVAVNVSPRQVDDPGFARLVRDTIAETNTLASRLTLEITETAIARGKTQTAAQLQALRSDGVRVEVDDFGIGFSSLARLKHLPLDAMKVDREFIRTLPDPEADRLLRGILEIAAALKLHTIVEGVETLEQEACTRAAGANAAQGWLYAKAMPASELTDWLRNHRTDGPSDETHLPAREKSAL